MVLQKILLLHLALCLSSSAMVSVAVPIVQDNGQSVAQPVGQAIAKAPFFIGNGTDIHGENIYSANMSTLGLEQTKIMYFGGELSKNDFQTMHDAIYYAKSADDGKTWGPARLAFTPIDVSQGIPGALPGVHVNDPTVSVTKSQANGSLLYTMFFTYTDDAIHPDVLSIFLGTSKDGIKWENFKKLDICGTNPVCGPGEPSVVSHDPDSKDPSQWWVYYVDRKFPSQARMVKVLKDGTVVGSPSTVFTSDVPVISSVEVKNFNGKWHLFYDKWIAVPGHSDQLLSIDIHHVVSEKFNFELSGPVVDKKVLVGSQNSKWCAFLTPMVNFPTEIYLNGLPKKVNNTVDLYDLYVGVIARTANPDGSPACNPGVVSPSQSIMHFEMAL